MLTTKQRTLVNDPDGPVLAVDFSPDGTLLVTGDGHGHVKLWEVHSGACRTRLQGHALAVCAVVFSPDGQTLASGSVDGALRLWSVPGQQCIATVCPDETPITSVAFSPQ